LDQAYLQLHNLIKKVVNTPENRIANWDKWKINTWMVERASGVVYDVIHEYRNVYYGKRDHMISPTRDKTADMMRRWAEVVPLVKAPKVNATVVCVVIESDKG
jgi:hypothetical protein